VKLLISLDVDINKANNIGTTPFSKACIYGHLEIVKLLISLDLVSFFFKRFLDKTFFIMFSKY
jgi:ankyrin repeat protein